MQWLLIGNSNIVNKKLLFTADRNDREVVKATTVTQFRLSVRTPAKGNTDRNLFPAQDLYIDTMQ